MEFNIKKCDGGHICVIHAGYGVGLEKVGDIVCAVCGAVKYESVGHISFFRAMGKSKSLRRDRSIIKRMIRMAA